MRRFIWCDPQESQFHEAYAKDFLSIKRVEEVNGEHAVTFVTTKELNRADRVIIHCDDGVVREYVVVKADTTHSGIERMYTEYYAVWSLQADLEGSRVTAELPESTTALDALKTAIQGLNAEPLSGTSRWAVNSDVTKTSALSLFHVTSWDALSEIVKAFGGEVESSVTVSGSKVSARSMSLLSHVGTSGSTRRFVWGRGLKSISRTVVDTPICCRIVPEGKVTEEDGVKTAVGIASVNDGYDYIQDNEMAARYMVEGTGWWEFPMAYARNSNIEDPQELLDWGRMVLHEYTRPRVSYDGSVYAFFNDENVERIHLGDDVQMVDMEFGGNGLRLNGRIMRISTDELNPRNVDVTIDNLKLSMASLL